MQTDGVHTEEISSRAKGVMSEAIVEHSRRILRPLLDEIGQGAKSLFWNILRVKYLESIFCGLKRRLEFANRNEFKNLHDRAKN